MAFERFRAHRAVIGALAVVALAGVSVLSLVLTGGRLAELDREERAGSAPTLPDATAPPSTSRAPSTTTTATVVPRPPAGFATELFTAMNSDRVTCGLEPLAWDDRLSATAQRVADAMAASGLVAHQDLSAILALGYARAAENVLTGPNSTSAAAAEYGWMGSTPHRAAILDANLRTVGIGATSDDGRIWIAVDFGG